MKRIAFLIYVGVCMVIQFTSAAGSTKNAPTNEKPTFECDICLQQCENGIKISTTCKVPHEICSPCLCQYWYKYKNRKCWKRCKEELKHPLLLATKCGNLRAIETILHNFEIDYTAIVDTLIEAGANADLCDVIVRQKSCKELFLEAVTNADFFLVQLLTSCGIDVNYKSDWENTALQIASEQENLGILHLLLAHGANVNERNFWAYNETALHSAIQKKSFRSVKILIKHGADVNFRDAFGDTPLLMLSSYGSKRQFQYLLDHGANIDDQDYFDSTVLHEASREGNVNLAKYLIKEQNANIDAQDKLGNTPLHRAVSENREAVIECLLENGADFVFECVFSFTFHSVQTG
jgi:hypothetical protein